MFEYVQPDYSNVTGVTIGTIVITVALLLFTVISVVVLRSKHGKIPENKMVYVIPPLFIAILIPVGAFTVLLSDNSFSLYSAAENNASQDNIPKVEQYLEENYEGEIVMTSLSSYLLGPEDLENAAVEVTLNGETTRYELASDADGNPVLAKPSDVPDPVKKEGN